ncbi:hypothetical protein [Dapis sp. BLCC M172]|uniref:hypothetical protein n=1 Tax=Dapis sp. BLCC M172 TaxID=2975281 RepID=UPI003CF5D4FE
MLFWERADEMEGKKKRYRNRKWKKVSGRAKFSGKTRLKNAICSFFGGYFFWVFFHHLVYFVLYGKKRVGKSCDSFGEFLLVFFPGIIFLDVLFILWCLHLFCLSSATFLFHLGDPTCLPAPLLSTITSFMGVLISLNVIFVVILCVQNLNIGKSERARKNKESEVEGKHLFNVVSHSAVNICLSSY